MSPDQHARALRLADEMERGQTLGYSWGVLDAVAFLRELAAEPKCNPTLTECPRCGNRADMQDSHCVMRGGTVMGKPFAVENPSARRTEPERVPLTDELAVSPQEVTEALRFVRTHLYAAQAQASPGDDSIIMRHVYDAYRRIADLTKEVELHGITGDAK